MAENDGNQNAGNSETQFIRSSRRQGFSPLVRWLFAIAGIIVLALILYLVFSPSDREDEFAKLANEKKALQEKINTKQEECNKKNNELNLANQQIYDLVDERDTYAANLDTCKSILKEWKSGNEKKKATTKQTAPEKQKSNKNEQKKIDAEQDARIDRASEAITRLAKRLIELSEKLPAFKNEIKKEIENILAGKISTDEKMKKLEEVEKAVKNDDLSDLLKSDWNKKKFQDYKDDWKSW